MPHCLCLRLSTAASEKAHFRLAFPIFAPEVPYLLPADSFADFTSLLQETKSCTLGRALTLDGFRYKKGDNTVRSRILAD